MPRFSVTPHVVVVSIAFLGAGVSVAHAQSPRAAPAGACERIKATCQTAGFVEGGGVEGERLWPDCLTPIMEGQERPPAAKPLPAIDPGLKEACLVERPEFARSPTGSPGPMPALRVTASAPTVFMTPEQMQRYGFAWGPSDGTFGAIALGEGRYRFFGGAHGGRQCPPTAQRTGVFAFTGTLDRVTGGEGCSILFGGGDPPAGWLFDANYAGGGQLIRFAAGGRTGWLMTFRGEYHWPNPARPDRLCGGQPPFDTGVPCYYSTLGLAVSTDGGRSFKVAGESLQLSDLLSASKGSSTVRNIGYGSLVLADANGRHVSHPPADPKAAYVYLFFVATGDDLPGVCSKGVQCPGVARARYEDVVAAVLSGNPHAVARVFRKYDAAAKDDPWSQPATGDSPDLSIGGGRFSPLYLGQGLQIVVYDRAFDVYLGVAVKFSATTLPGFVIRTSADLIHWSEPIGPPIADGNRAVAYVTLLGETSDPSIAGEEPRLYFSSTEVGPGPRSSAFKVVRLSLSRK